MEPSYLSAIRKRLGLDDSMFESIMNGPIRSFRDFDSYLPRFRDPMNKGFFDVLLKDEKIPFTFYKKYVLGV